jgi:hypothetical protein
MMAIEKVSQGIAPAVLNEPKRQDAASVQSPRPPVPHTAAQRANDLHPLDPSSPAITRTSHFHKTQDLATAARNTNSVGAPQAETQLDRLAAGESRDPNRPKPVDE